MNTRIRIAAVVVVIAAAAAGYFYWQNKLNSQLPNGIAFGNGRIEAVQVDISTKIPGRVQDIFANEGDLVQPDQKVALINTDQLKAQHLKAQADIASAQSQVAAAEASIAQAKAQLRLAEQELERASSLVKQGHTSKETYDTRVSNRAVAVANLRAAEATLVSRQRSVDAARAVAQEIKTQIDDSLLVSPMIGRVLYRLAEPGEVLGAGGKVLTLINLSDIYMEIFLPSAQAHRVNIGAEARIKLDILDFAIPAKISFVSPESQFTPKQVETPSERDKLMFRIKVRVPQELVLKHIDRVKTGVRGMAYVWLDGASKPEWPEFLQKLPPDVPQTARGK
ncbi:MAG: HlyD family efflux transporter periplasmic adaptor subunit [Hyphomicrobiales bacterium]|nr:HlyD family efflux transporter periplasmic adaptor subunit [Hyphomicrobiales bacterium]